MPGSKCNEDVPGFALRAQPRLLQSREPPIQSVVVVDDTSRAAALAATRGALEGCFKACASTFSFASCISARQSASVAPPKSISGRSAANGVAATPNATDVPTRTAIGATAGWTFGDLKLPSIQIGPRSATALGFLDLALSVRS